MVEYKLEITPECRANFRNIPQKYHKPIKAAIQEIREVPQEGKPLEREMKGRHAWHVSVYRIIYKVYPRDKKIVILSVKHRGIAYN
ncbi:MAG: type II toxin-antitoxin system RelE/ParE family toxin [Patescibacteria group bacterium]